MGQWGRQGRLDWKGTRARYPGSAEAPLGKPADRNGQVFRFVSRVHNPSVLLFLREDRLS